jgi:hypothetical protein
MYKFFGKMILMICGLSVIAHAEYRMFTLKITNTQTKDYRLVDSTLDPIQYPFYYPVQKDEIVQYADTWRCYGNTGGGKPPCPSPRAPAAESSGQNQGPAPRANP